MHFDAETYCFCSPFPTVAESIQKELDEYRASEEEVKRLKNVMVRLASLVSVHSHPIVFLSGLSNRPFGTGGLVTL